MLKAIAIAAALLLGQAGASFAATFKLGVPPIAQVTIPDGWSPEETDDGVEANSPDGEIYLSIEVKAAGDLEKAFIEAFKWVESKGVKIDGKSQVTAEGNINEFPVFRIVYEGKDEDGDDNVIAVTALKVNENTAMLMTAWGYPGSEAKNDAALKRILGSLKTAK